MARLPAGHFFARLLDTEHTPTVCMKPGVGTDMAIRNVGRRGAMVIGGAAALSASAVFAQEPPKPASIVVNHSGGAMGAAMRKAFFNGFEKKYGIRVVETSPADFGKLRAMAMGEIPVDDMAAVKGARDVAVLAGMLPEGFIPNSAVKGSAALPEIWTNFPDFEQKAKDLQTAATALADAAQANGFEASKGMVQAVGQSCGGCHRPYRRREE